MRYAVIVLLILCLALSVSAQQGVRKDLIFSNFSGGINVSGDTIGIANNQAAILDNLIMEWDGRVRKRYGYQNWNDSLFASNHRVQDIHYVEHDTTYGLYIATDSFVFVADGWEQFGDSSDWATGERIVSYTGDSIFIDTSGGTAPNNDIFGIGTHFIMHISAGDIVEIGDTTRFIVDTVFADTLLQVTTAVGAYHGDSTADYQIMKVVKGNIKMSSYNKTLYVADDAGEAWTYNGVGSDPRLFSVLDSGTVDSIITVSDSVIAYYSEGQIRFEFGASVVENGADAMFHPDSGYVSAGDYLYITAHMVGRPDPNNPPILEWNFSARIDSVGQSGDSGGWGYGDGYDLIFLRRPVVGESFSPPLTYGASGVYYAPPNSPPYNWPFFFTWRVAHRTGSNQSDVVQSFIDTAAAWATDQYVDYYIGQSFDASLVSRITGNESDRISYTSSVDFNGGDGYYIYRSPPMGDSISTKGWWYDKGWYYSYKTIFSEIIFHRNRMYAIGKDVLKGNYSAGGMEWSKDDTVNTSRVWYSEVGQPNYIRSDWNFDITGAQSSNPNASLASQEVNVDIFILKDDLYVMTHNSIYRISGEPYGDLLDLRVSHIVSGVGTTHPKGVVVGMNNQAYIMNDGAIWKFDGNFVEEISLLIDPNVTGSLRHANMVAGLFGNLIFFSYGAYVTQGEFAPSQAVTYVMHYLRPGAFTSWPFGMSAINNQSVVADSNYFLFSTYANSGYVMRYPGYGDKYYDRVVNDSSYVAPKIQSGWISLDPGYKTVVERFSLTAKKGIMPLTLSFYVDFQDTTIFDYSLGNGADRKTWREKVSQNVKGDYFRWEIKQGTGITPDSVSDFNFSNLKVRCYSLQQE